MGEGSDVLCPDTWSRCDAVSAARVSTRLLAFCSSKLTLLHFSSCTENKENFIHT